MTSVYDADDYEPASGELLERWPESMYEDAQDSPVDQHAINPRHSSLQARDILATAGDKPPADEAILMELVSAKTREAEAVQQRDEMRVSLEKMRKQQDETEKQLAAQKEALQAQQEAHKAELDKLRRSIAVVRSVPSLELRPAPAAAEVSSSSGSLWPTPAPSPRDPPVTPVRKDSTATAGESAGGWGWFGRSATKQRSVSTGNAGGLAGPST